MNFVAAILSVNVCFRCLCLNIGKYAVLPCLFKGLFVFSRMESVAKALEEVLSSALPQGCITVGVYEAAKSLNA